MGKLWLAIVVVAALSGVVVRVRPDTEGCMAGRVQVLRGEPAAEAVVRKAAHVALAVGRRGEVVARVVGVARREERAEVLDDLR
jgi:hypothetical protein